jgi:hypothetical protein
MCNRWIEVARLPLVLSIVFASAGLLAPGRAEAIGIVDLSWDACSPIVSERVRDGAHPYSLYASVLGHDTPHRAYQVFIVVETIGTPPGAFTPYPDAWRFDVAGCQTTSLIRIDAVAPLTVAAACPSFYAPPPPMQSFQIRDFSFDAVSNRARGVLANSYPSGSATTTNPAQRYFLARFEFDHTFSVVGPGDPGTGEPELTCGEFETDMSIRLTSAEWLDLNGNQRSWLFGRTPVTFCSSCAVTSALPATWGAIKGQYRR